MPKRKRIPELTKAQIDALIARIAKEKRAKNPGYEEKGLTNSEIVDACLPEARPIMSRNIDELVCEYVAARIPMVLPAPSGRTRFPSLLPELDIPAWLPVPPIDTKGAMGWKQQSDLTPNQISRIVEHRTKEIDGRIVEKNKLVLLRETAIEKGCDLDDPIRTVIDFRDPNHPSGPEDHPSP